MDALFFVIKLLDAKNNMVYTHKVIDNHYQLELIGGIIDEHN